jgi:hypothetical protein
MKRSLAAAAAAALALLAGAPPAGAKTGSDYLRSRLQPSGGFAEAGTSRASASLTEWTVMGLAAAGRRPGRMNEPGGRTPRRYLAGRAAGWRDAYQLSRGILAVVALGRDPRRFGSRNLARALRNDVQVGSGRIGPYANSTYWGVLAFRAARARLPERSLRYIRSRQRSNGGYSWSSAAPADSNDTAAAVLALRAGGVRCSSRPVAGAYRFLRTLRKPSGGYSLLPGDRADSMSTSWVVQARMRCHRANRRALAYLRDRKRPSGAYNFRKGDSRTPAWVTAQVLPATNGDPYPVRP